MESAACALLRTSSLARFKVKVYATNSNYARRVYIRTYIRARTRAYHIASLLETLYLPPRIKRYAMERIMRVKRIKNMIKFHLYDPNDRYC